MKSIKSLMAVLVVSFMVVSAVGFWVLQTLQTEAGAPSGLPTSMATSSTVAMGQATVSTLFATSTYCTSRVIGTVADAIIIQFSPGIGGVYGTSSLQNGFGYVQAASTTVAYDAGLYGCGAWIARGNTGSTTLNISEFR